MAKKKRKKPKERVAHVQGRTLVGKAKVHAFQKGFFAYKGQVYDIDDFPDNCRINLDTTKVISLGKWEKPEKQNKKKNRGYRKKFQAHLISNLENCPDVQAIIEETSNTTA